MRAFTVILTATAAMLVVSGPAHAGWKWSRARSAPPVAYDLNAIDDVLATPDYDVAAIDSLIRAATTEPISWRAEGFVPTRAGKGGKGRGRPPGLRLSPQIDQETAAWVEVHGRAAADLAAVYSEWSPGRLVGSSGDFDIEFIPHAGMGVSAAGRRAEFGGAVRLGGIGFSARDGRELGSEGRWHLFAAASGQSLGWNFNNSEGPWRGLGLTHDRSSSSIASAQAGIAWRKGPLVASLGYARRKVRSKGDLAEWSERLDLDLFPTSDDTVALTVSLLPR